MPYSLQTIERCKPLLGTFVRIRLEGLEPARATEALARCFAELTEIHRLMSFQEAGSEISCLNRDAHRQPVRVDVRTWEVLRQAAVVSEQSDGAFDVTVAPHLVRARLNSAPANACTPDPRASWSDVRLLPDQYVHFMRPLWIDLSGIAKGYAVDRAMAILTAAAPAQACVNAGGDLSVRGSQTERVRLDVELQADMMIPVVELKDGSLASSGARRGAGLGEARTGVYIDGAKRRPAPQRFVTVLASSCLVADALTKVVMATGADAVPVLRSFCARAIMSDGLEWREVA